MITSIKLCWNPFITLITVINVITPKQIPSVARVVVTADEPFRSTFANLRDTKKIQESVFLMLKFPPPLLFSIDVNDFCLFYAIFIRDFDRKSVLKIQFF